MGWSIGFDKRWGKYGRDIGYGVPATCDHPGCGEEIDRGLSYVCGGDAYGGEHGCGLFFCREHLTYEERDGHLVPLCERCAAGADHAASFVFKANLMAVQLIREEVGNGLAARTPAGLDAISGKVD